MAKYDGWALSCAAVQTNPQTTLSLTCADNNAADVYSCSAGSRLQVILAWPVASAGNQSYTLNTRCNPNESDSNACVIKDLTL